MKNRTEELAGKLKLSEVLEKPWTYLMVDFITKLPVVAGKDTILVVCDRLSKMTYFVATTEGILAEELARVVGISGVCSKQQGSYCNQGFAFHGKL